MGEWVGEWVRGYGWLACFAVLFSAAYTNYCRNASNTTAVVLLYVLLHIHCCTCHCSTTGVKGGCVDRLVHGWVGVGARVNESVGWYVGGLFRACGGVVALSLICFFVCYNKGFASMPALCFCPLYRPHSGIAPRTPSNIRMTATGTCALEEPNRSEHTGPKRAKY